MTTETTVTKATKQRHQLNLPIMHFVVVDDWFGKIGEKSFTTWLKLLTMVDRKHTDHTVRYSQQSLAKELGVSRPTLIKHLQPLYEYGFIEYTEYNLKGKVMQNIVVYEAPLNDDANLLKPLVKVRDWEKRTEEKFDFTKKGGRKKKEVTEEVETNVDVDINVNVEAETKIELNEIVETKIDLCEARLLKNGINLHKLKEWASTTKEPVDRVIKVIDNMANYHEPIEAMKAFIKGGLKKIKEAEAVEAKKAEFVPSIPMFNWLEEQA
jgi:DNA-binding Lrp family transcriptional regulator